MVFLEEPTKMRVLGGSRPSRRLDIHISPHLLHGHQVVIDAGAAIRLKRLERFGGHLFTTSGVYAEVQTSGVDDGCQLGCQLVWVGMCVSP